MKREKDEADMHLPGLVFGLGIFLAASAAAITVFAIVSGYYAAAAADILLLPLAAAAFLCYNNQKIWVVNDKIFEYSTMFGKRKKYEFDRIDKIVQNTDSFTVFAEGDRIHIESMAVCSRRLMDLLIKAADKKSSDDDDE